LRTCAKWSFVSQKGNLPFYRGPGQKKETREDISGFAVVSADRSERIWTYELLVPNRICKFVRQSITLYISIPYVIWL